MLMKIVLTRARARALAMAMEIALELASRANANAYAYALQLVRCCASVPTRTFARNSQETCAIADLDRGRKNGTEKRNHS